MILDLFCQDIPETINVRVTVRAKSQRIKKEVTSSGDVLYRVYVSEPPENGKANDAVLALVAKELGISKSRVSILIGKTSRNKVIGIAIN